jgi:cyclic beta-1,2-glucan synthetase
MPASSTQPEVNSVRVAVFDEVEPGSGLKDRMRQLAKTHTAERAQGERPLLIGHLDAYERMVNAAVQHFRSASQKELATTYSAEWILDNYYIVLQAIRQIKEDLPEKYYQELPKLISGDLKGYPRIYSVAREIISEQRALLDLDDVSDIIRYYEDEQPLLIGELWALPIMLRLSIVQALVLSLSQITTILLEVDHFTASIDLSERVSHEEVVANTIISLRRLIVEDWKEFFENLSQLEQILREDPAGIYSRMDFETRDAYRKVVEDISMASKKGEQEIARAAIDLAIKGAEANSGGRSAHVGFYLIDKGRRRLEEAVGYKPPTLERLKRWLLDHPTQVYLSGIGSITFLLLAIIVSYAFLAGTTFLTIVFVILVLLIPALTVAVDMTNWVVTHILQPRVLPKMDFSEGVPPESRTMVVIPTLLSNDDEIDSLIQQLELHYLRNADPNLHFALATDFIDAPQQDMPGDEALLEKVVRSIQALNDRYQSPDNSPFFLFHRERRWNPKEGVWMGWERKRGKLHELNRVILENGETTFSNITGDLDVIKSIRYIITLDADTILPGKNAHRLAAAIAHPLNQAEIDLKRGKVINGYAVLQPRTAINPSSSNHSLFTRVFSGDTGLDLYTLAVSDVYQDLFGDGIYVGKGIYDVRAFELCLEGVAPENTLLSHDLFEGIHTRAGLVTDIVLIEDYPPNYLIYIRRLHRWIRGDWQLLPWLFPKVPAAPEMVADHDYTTSLPRKIPNRLSWIDRWKIIDNLRRSLLAPVLMFLFVFGWTWFPGSALLWTLLGLITLSIPFITEILSGLIGVFTGSRDEETPGLNTRSLGNTAFRWLLAVVFLPYEALFAVDAIVTTIIRVFITRKNLLKWTTAAHTARLINAQMDARGTLRQMAAALMLALLLVILLALVSPEVLPVAFPLLLLWLVSPEIAFWISRSIIYKPKPATEAERNELRKLAYRTWLFFEQFVGPEDHWLPPDHFQESPKGVLAHRTSPTNIGLAVSSMLSAYDLGYLGKLDLVARLRTVFESLNRLEKYRGHFLNWYDTRNLEPLPPRYVSTVDSGNLAAALISAAQACRGILDEPLHRKETWLGLLDSINLLVEPVEKLAAEDASEERSHLEDYLEELKMQVKETSENLEAWSHTAFHTLSKENWEELDNRLMALLENIAPSLSSDRLRRLHTYARSARGYREAILREFDILLPWMKLLTRLPVIFKLEHRSTSLGAEIDSLLDLFRPSPTLNSLEGVKKRAKIHLEKIEEYLKERDGKPQVKETLAWIAELCEALEDSVMNAKVLVIGYEEIQRQCESILQDMDFTFLFNRQRQVFHIGYNVGLGKHDDNYYDLLASEARIASIIAIARGDAPLSHWLHLSRPLTQVNGSRALLSWSATMFEYLMPMLYLKSYEGTLLHQSGRAAVDLQIDYGKQKKVPWGISESGYYRFDDNQNYQYRAFGVPGLGFKRGLSEDLVIAPYASLLGLPFKPQEVLKNIEEFSKFGMMGIYGLYEAIDFTPGRMAFGEKYKIVRSFMSHHQGMILLAITNFLKEDIMVERTHYDLRISSVELLLQEQIPHGAPLEKLHSEDGAGLQLSEQRIATNPWQVNPFPPQPRVQYLSNGRYSILVTSSGGGYSVWKENDLTRWRADATLDDWGQWLYLHDLDRDAVWSAAFQPVGIHIQSDHVFFNAHMVQFQRRENDISIDTEITVSPEDDLEIRLIRLTNHSGDTRRLRLTSYAEVVMAPQASDERHPAFNKLFIHSEYISSKNALIFQRRPRSNDEDRIFMAHALVLGPGQKASGVFETDRAKFLGRGGTLRRPEALQSASEDTWLSNSAGATLDPIMALGQDVILEQHSSFELAFVTAAASSRYEVLSIIGRFSSFHMLERAFDQAKTNAEVQLVRFGLNTQKLNLIQRLLSILIYPHPALRAESNQLAANTKGQPSLWAYGISGDYPILLLRVHAQENLSLVQEVLQAHAYWRSRKLEIDLVIVNEQGTDYGQELNQALHRMLSIMKSESWLNRRGGIFIMLADQLPEGDRSLFYASARALLDGKGGSLEEQLERLEYLPVRLPPFSPDLAGEDAAETPTLKRPEDLLFDNGLGGFSQDGKEYVIYLEQGKRTPAPWVNVIANPGFGFMVSETGSGNSWAENSGENRLTPWNNDPVIERPGEAIYLRDEETGRVWSPTPLPARGDGVYRVRHGAGYSIFEHNSQGLRLTLRLFAAHDAPVKIASLRLENTWNQNRRLTATYFAEWVLGVNRSITQPYLIPEYDDETQALLVRNPYNSEFAGRVAFLSSAQPVHGLTADREEFLGRMGSRTLPEALARIGLSGSVQPGQDTCGAVQVHVDIEVGGSQEIIFILGQGADRDEAKTLIHRYKDVEIVEEAWQEARRVWDELLGTIQVRTPEPSMDLLLNRWMLYQALSCRIWGRSGFYQSSGAYGFRDQLQDVSSLVHAVPGLIREHILRSAARQFDAGDVLHWWHPPSGRGVRTRYSDDLLWLPYITSYYIDATGDTGILDEEVPFLKGPLLEPQEKERYGFYESTEAGYSLFEHCRRAIEKGSTTGRHGLPLIGGGDWNDGMNRVGVQGKGESVWLGWFLYDTLNKFAAICDRVDKAAQGEAFRYQAERYRQAIEENAWDGEWYRRAYYDSGHPLGSSKNRECKIDAIAQSWSVISKGGDPERAERAMRSVSDKLILREDRLLLLFKPPFDRTPRDPGYIKGYLPGIRENGGQYTHAAIWTVWAFAELGDGNTANELFRLLNPILHGDTPERIARYLVEPYVIAADVYSQPPLTGHGGWTWYTGSSGWMYRLGLEAILGLRKVENELVFNPCISQDWPGFEIDYRYGKTLYQIKVDNPVGVNRGVKEVRMNGKVIKEGKVPLVDDGKQRKISILMGEKDG